MKFIHFIVVAIPLLFNGLFGQGLINNGAQIHLNSGVTVYVNGANGHYTNQNGGLINNVSVGGTVAVAGNWYNNANNVAFNNDGTTTILLGGAQSIGGTNPTAFYNLNLAGTNTKSLAVATTTVGGRLTTTGVLALGARPLDLNSNRLDITNNAGSAITNSSGYIISETNVAVNPSTVRWVMGTTTGAHTIPFGLSGSVIPFTFNVTTAMTSAAAYVDVSTRATSNASNTPWAGASNVAAVSHMYSPVLGTDGSVKVVVDRWWNITPSHSVTANVTFSYLGVENTLAVPYQTGLIGAQHWTGAAWEPPVGSAVAVTSGVGAVTANGLSSFSPYVLSSIVAPLPIELLNFDYTCEKNKPVLSWCTATETNNNYFSILHSDDGINFSTIATVPGSGTKSSKTCYHYSSNQPLDLSHVNYFKLSQTDFNNATKVFSTISVSDCNEALDNISIVNEDENSLGVKINSSTGNVRYEITLTNSLGQLMLSLPVVVTQGYNYIPVEVLNVANSVYYLSVVNSTNGKAFTKKVIISN